MPISECHDWPDTGELFGPDGTRIHLRHQTADVLSELVRQLIVVREVERANAGSPMELEYCSLLVAAIGLKHRFLLTEFQRARDLLDALIAEGFVLTNLLPRLDEAEEQYDMALEFNPSEPVGSLLRESLHAFRGDGSKDTRDADARETTEHLLSLQPGLTVGKWLDNSPSRDFPVGHAFAETLLEIDVPE